MQENVKNGISTRDCGKIEADKRTRLGGGERRLFFVTSAWMEALQFVATLQNKLISR